MMQQLDLSTISIITGVMTIVFFLPALLFPDQTLARCKTLPRSSVLAWILTALAVGWAGWLLYNAPFLAEIPHSQTAVIILTPLSFLALVFFLDELLAARAFGGILLLAPRYILDAAFMNDSGWKLVMTLFAYVIVITGVLLVLSPFRFRTIAQALLRTKSSGRLAGATGVGLGVLIVVLAMTAYKINT